MKIVLSNEEIIQAIVNLLSEKEMKVGLDEVVLKCEWDQEYDRNPTNFFAEIELKS